MKKLKRISVNKWLAVCRPAVANEIPDYDGASGYDAEIQIYDQIGQDYWGETGVSAQDFKAQLDTLKGKKVLLRLHSPGGNVYDAMAIHNAIQEHGKVDTKIDGLAASAASAIFQAGNKRIMSPFSMQMAHRASSLTIGNSEDMSKEAAVLQKHDEALAKMYSARSGKSVDDCMAIMDTETWMDGDESLANKFCDELTDEPDPDSGAVDNRFDLSKFKNRPAKAARFNLTNPKQTGADKAPQNHIVMNRDEMIALLKERGVAVANDATDQWLKDQLKALTAKQNAAPAPAPTPVVPPVPPPPPALPPEIQARLDALEQRANAEAKINIESRVNKIIENDQCPAARREWLVTAALKDKTILDTFESLPSKPPGFNPVTNIVVADTTAPAEILKGATKNCEALAGYVGGRFNQSKELREAVGKGSRANGAMIRKLTDNLCAKLPDSAAYENRRREVIADFCDQIRMNDTQQGPFGTATVSSDLQRQVIMSEAMRAFRRRLVPLSLFAHNFGNVPLEGKDEIDVPYYPLNTTQSQRFTTANGYQLAGGGGNDVAQRKQILVGGVGGNNKVPGQDRAYQQMTWSSYLLRRQPWVDIQKLAVMRSEQLALDILNDIITAWILKANFGVAAWTGAPTGFDNTVIAMLKGVASKLDWPEQMRQLVLGTDYYTNLLADPAVHAYLNIGSTEPVREGRVGGLYGFADTVENPRIPVTTDGNLIGWISYPSAILVATSPILPAPGVLKLLVAYDIVTDDQTGLSFEYRYWGIPQADTDQEIIECNYGSGLGELAALKRLVATGN